MKIRREAEQVAQLINEHVHSEELKRLIKKSFGIKLHDFTDLNIETIQDIHNEFYVELRTDGHSYHAIYDGNEVLNNVIQAWLLSILMVKLGKEFSAEGHYFEKMGNGILVLY